MSTQPELPYSDVYNPSLFDYTTDALTIATADLRYVRLGTNMYVPSITVSGLADVGSLKIGGTLVDLSSITGVTPGIVSASKAVVVDSNKDIASFRNVGMEGNLSLTASAPMISSSNPISANKTITITGDGTPTMVSGLNLCHTGISSTSNIKAYNFMSSQLMNLNLNNNAVYCKSDGTVSINKNTNGGFALDVNGFVNTQTKPISDNTTVSATTEFVQNEFLDRASSTFSPTGFQNQTDSTISYNASTRVLTIAPVSSSFTVWIKGTKHVYTSIQTAAAHTNAVGTYIYYFDDSGVLQWSSTPPSYASPYVADAYYFDSTHTLVLDERHGCEMDVKTHIELHNVTGTWFKEGLALSNYTIAPASPVTSDNTFASSSGIIMDEDLASTIGAIASGGPYTVMYLTGTLSQWTFSFANNVPYNYGTYIKYNQWNGSTWLMTESTSGDFVNYYVVYLPSLSSTTQMVVIPSQTVYGSQANAIAEDFGDLSLGSLSSQVPEYLVRYRITFRTGSGYGSAGKCRIQQLDMIVGSRAIIQNSVATNHQSLSGLELASTGSTYGHVNDTAQTIAGAKTFSDTMKVPKLLVGTTTDTTRLISALNGGGSNASLSIGAANTDRSQCEITYVDSATATDRKCHIGLFGSSFFDLATIRGNQCIGIKQTSPAYTLDVGGDINLTGSIRNGSTVFMNSSGVIQVAAQPNITSVGTLSSLTATNITGTLLTAAQPNITSTGTLSSLTISSAANNMLTLTQTNSGNLSNILFTASGSTNSEIGLRAGSASNFPNYMYIYRGGYKFLMDSTGKVALGVNAPTEALDVQTGSINTSTSYKIAGTTILTSSGYTGTLLTAAQPNITSVGTLTNLTVAGSIAGTLASGNQPGITSVGLLASLETVGNIYSAMTSVTNQNSFANAYNLTLKASTNTVGDRNGIAFHMTNSGNTISTPHAIISCVRGTLYDGSLVFGTKSDSTINGPCPDRFIIASDGAITAINSSTNAISINSTAQNTMINQVTTAVSCNMLTCTVANSKVAVISLAQDALNLDSTTGVLRLGTNAISHWQVDSNGYFAPWNSPTTKRVGILTTNPAVPLHIGQTVSDKLILVYGTGVGSDDAYAIGANGSQLRMQGVKCALYSGATSASVGTQCLVAHAAKVSIGSTEGSMDLNIIKASASVRLGHSESTNNCVTLQWINSGTPVDNYLSFDFFGSTRQFVVSPLGIAVQRTGAQILAPLHIESSNSFTYTDAKFYNVATDSYSTVSSGSFNISAYFSNSIWCNSSLMTSSDARLKSNVMSYDISDEDFLKLKPKRYLKDGEWEIGLIAQDVVKDIPNYPDIINPMPKKGMKNTSVYDPDDDFVWTVAYDRLPLMIIKVLQRILSRQSSCCACSSSDNCPGASSASPHRPSCP